MNFTDAVAVAGTRRTADGYLIADAKAVRTGIQLYLGAEVGRPEMPVVRVYRSEDEVRSADSLRSFSHAPVTVDHPANPVTADNWRDLAVGEVSTSATWDGNRISLPLILKDADAISAVVNGKRELSAGYSCDLIFTPGTTPDGQTYDAQQKNIRANHVAIVDRGRAGKECRIGDEAIQHEWGAAPITPPVSRIGDSWAAITTPMETPMKTLMVDGITVEMSDTAVQVVGKVLQQLSDAKATVDAQEKKIGELNTAVSTKDGEIAVLKKQVEDGKMTPQQIDAAVVARSAVIADAKAITGKDVTADGKTDAAIRREAVEAKLGDAAKNLDDAAILGAFKALRVAAPADPVRDALSGGLRVVGDASQQADAAWDKSVTDLNSWRKEA